MNADICSQPYQNKYYNHKINSKKLLNKKKEIPKKCAKLEKNAKKTMNKKNV